MIDVRWVLIVGGMEVGKPARASLASDEGETKHANVPYSVIKDVAYLHNVGFLSVNYSEISGRVQLDITGNDENTYRWLGYVMERGVGNGI